MIPDPDAGGFFKNNERRLYNRGNYGGYVMNPSTNEWNSDMKIPD